MALYAFDGTGQDDRNMGTDLDAIEVESNIWKFYSAYDGYTRRQGIMNVYVPGVGTTFGPLHGLDAFAGSIWGVGWLPRINFAYNAACAAFVSGDQTIDVIGFSRGAALALEFVNELRSRGIKNTDGQVIEQTPRVRFLGLFDCVPAIGVGNLGPGFNEIHIGVDLDLPPTVDHAFHALALDERRPQFVVHRVDGAYEVWFRGVHSDIGGSNRNLGLNYIALRWMLRKAILCGLPVTEANINDAACRPADPINPTPFSEASLFWRAVEPGDLLHYTVAQHAAIPGEECNDCPPRCSIETVDMERTRLSAPTAIT